MMKIKILALAGLLLSFSAYSKIRLNVEVVYKKGINKGLVLTSEYHSIEEVSNYGMAKLKLKNDLEIYLTASFFDNKGVYGPSNLIKIDGQLFIREKKVKDSFFNKEVLIPIGEKKQLIYKDDAGHQVELSITPEIR